MSKEEEKIKDFIKLMTQIKDEDDDVIEDEPPCPICKSCICAMVQRLNDLECYTKYK
jgi:hypothetical protein